MCRLIHEVLAHVEGYYWSGNELLHVHDGKVKTLKREQQINVNNDKLTLGNTYMGLGPHHKVLENVKWKIRQQVLTEWKRSVRGFGLFNVSSCARL